MFQYLIALYLLKSIGDATFYDDYDANVPFKTEIAAEETRDGYHRTKLYFDTQPGERLPVILTRPLAPEGKAPCVIFLHGIGQGKEFIDEITAPFNRAGFAMATFDQYMQGERKLPRDTHYLLQAKAFRRRAAVTVVDTRRLVDYLQSREDIDPNRIYLVGASYGAITGSTATAKEPRLRAAVLVYGGGNLEKLLNAPLIREGAGRFAKLLDPVVVPFAKFYLGIADPVRHVGGIAPRPVLFQNGSKDTLVCPRAGQAFYDACREPKSISWYDSDHFGLNGGMDKEIYLAELVLDEALAWIKDRDREILDDAA